MKDHICAICHQPLADRSKVFCLSCIMREARKQQAAMDAETAALQAKIANLTANNAKLDALIAVEVADHDRSSEAYLSLDAAKRIAIAYTAELQKKLDKAEQTKLAIADNIGCAACVEGAFCGSVSSCNTHTCGLE